MLEDFDGLRRRVLQLQKERAQCDQNLQTKEFEVDELREQLNQRDEAVKHIERLNERNLDEYMRSFSDAKMGFDKEQTQTSLHIRNMQD